jgi:diguanylate cyclase (GGDEF)-like protein
MNKGALHFLIVDDDNEDIMLLKGLLRRGLRGVDVRSDTANSFADGLSRIATSQYDLLFFDYQLEERSGLDLIRDLRTNGVTTPVVLLTGRGDEEIAVEAMKVGASDSLPKSKLSETLVRKSVHYAIDLHEKEMQRQRMEDDLRKTNERLESWASELERLNQMGNALQACLTLDEAYALVARHTSEFFPNRSGALTILDGSKNEFTVAAAWGQTPPHVHDFTAADCWALRQHQPCGVRNSSLEAACPLFEGSSATLHFCVPMVASGELMGVLILQANEHPSGVDSQASDSHEQAQFAQMLGEQLAFAVANLKLREDLRSQAWHDPLTGLFNRRYMEEFIERSAFSAQRHNRALAVLMLDLDDFKLFNDTHGHLAGDNMLKSLGRFLQMHTRGEDIACRYGGEEFVLILPEVPLAAAAQRAEQLRTRLKIARPIGDSALPSVPTISVGISAAPEHGCAPQTLLRIADAALYRAKMGGRDRVVVGEALAAGDDHSVAYST